MLESKNSLTISGIFAGKRGGESEASGLFTGIGMTLLVMARFLRTMSNAFAGKKQQARLRVACTREPFVNIKMMDQSQISFRVGNSNEKVKPKAINIRNVMVLQLWEIKDIKM